jgi:acetyl esterase/lipase
MLTATSCRGDAGGHYSIEEDMAYREGEQTEAMKERCRLDLYYPKEAKDYPTVVWFHGGGLREGNKHIPDELKGKGMAIAAANYRLTPEAKVKDCLDDAAAAVAWVFRNIAKYGGSTEKIFVSGHSAGGYLASMVGLDKAYLGKYDLDADKLAGLIPYSGHTITHMAARDELNIPNTQPLVNELAPLYHVRPDAPPMLILTGDREQELYGRYEECAYFWRMMKVVKHPQVELIEIQGTDHGGMVGPGHPHLIQFVSKIAGLKKPEERTSQRQ